MRMTETDADLATHPLARLIPPMADDEFERLTEDIRAHGLH